MVIIKFSPAALQISLVFRKSFQARIGIVCTDLANSDRECIVTQMQALPSKPRSRGSAIVVFNTTYSLLFDISILKVRYVKCLDLVSC